MLQNEKTAE